MVSEFPCSKLVRPLEQRGLRDLKPWVVPSLRSGHYCPSPLGLLKELGHHISDHNDINSTAILFLPYKEAISLDYCQFTGLWVQ